MRNWTLVVGLVSAVKDLGRRTVMVITVSVAAALASVAAFAVDPTTPGELVTTIATQLKTDILSVGAAVAVIIGLVLAVRFGLNVLARRSRSA